MKIVCDACSAKYSIADEKVAGKVFKIRCKKCSNIIVVRGTSAEEPAQDPYAQQDPYGGYGDQGGDPNAVWHLVINQEQVGPLSDAEVRQRFASGEVDLETYTWREGFDNWSPLGQVDVFADLASAGAAGGDAVSNMFGSAQPEDNATVQQDPADLFSGSPAAGGDDGAASDLFGAAPAAAAGGGLFGGGAEESQPAGGGIQMSADAERRLRGERNENSVLFSLNNLAALASESPKATRGGGPAPARSSGGGGGGGGGGARPQLSSTGGSEGSGLIDIRAMASVYHGDPGASSGPAGGSDDDLPVFGQSSFASAAPVILPATNASNSNKTLYIMLGVIGMLVVAAAILVVLVVKGGDDEKTPAVAANTGDTTDVGDKGDKGDKPDEKPADGTDKPDGDTAATNGTDKPADATGTGDKPADTAETKPEDKPADDAKKSDSGASKRRSSSSSSRRSSKKSSSSKKKTDSPPPKKKKSSGGCLDEVGCLLADKPPSCCSKFSGGSKKKSSSKKTSSSGGGTGPEKLSRSDISGGMSKIKGRVTSCGSRHPGKGQVKIKVKVAGSGKVSSATVKSSPNASLGSCVASAVKKAKFPKSQKGASFTYPFVF